MIEEQTLRVLVYGNHQRNSLMHDVVVISWLKSRIVMLVTYSYHNVQR